MGTKGKNTVRDIVVGIVCLILGVLFLVFRNQVFEAIYGIFLWGLAIGFWVAGVVGIIFFIKDRSRVGSLIMAIVSIVSGILLVVFKDLIIWVLCFTIGVLLFLDGVFKISRAVTYMKAKAKGAAIPLCFGIINIVLGALAILSPIRFAEQIGAFIVVIGGIVLIVYGIQCLISGVSESKN